MESDNSEMRDLYPREFGFADQLVLRFETLWQQAQAKHSRIDELKDPHLIPMFQHCARILKTSRAIVKLAELGYGEDAGSLARSHMETVLHLMFIAKEPHLRGLLFSYGEHSSELNGIKRLRDSGNLLPEHGDVGQKEIELKGLQVKVVERIQKSFPDFDLKSHQALVGRGWTGRSLGQIARELGVVGDRQYNVTYWLLSGFSHPDPYWMQSYRQPQESGVQIDARRSNTYVREIIAAALCYNLLAASGALNDFFALNVDETLGDLETEYRSMMNRESREG